MCAPALALPLLGAAVSAGATYLGGQQANNASAAMAAAENARQQRYQQQQARLIAQQEENKKKGREAFASLQPQVSKEETDKDQQANTAARDSAYQQAIAPVFQQQGADPTASNSADVTTVGAPAAPKAVTDAYSGQQQRAQAFSGQQAKARAFLDALGDTQYGTNQKLARGSQNIGMYGDFVSGMNRPIQAVEGLKNSSSTLYQQGANAAAHSGDSMMQLGSLLGSLSQLGYGYATMGGLPKAASLIGATGATNLASSRPILA